MAQVKRVGILTSGGDCAGLNAVIRAVVYAGTNMGLEIIGIEDGTEGFLSRPVRHKVLNTKMFDTTIMRLGGTILGTTNKGNPFNYPLEDGTFKDRTEEIIEGFRELRLDALIGIGGDGSLDILSRLAKKGGINLVGIPKTIDNDLGMTENSIGFETAVSVATEALDRLQPTAASHERVMVLEVMGRDAGHIALSAGLAGGADVVLIPEINYSLDSVIQKIKKVREEEGRNFSLVIVSEAVKTTDDEAVQVIHSDGQKRYGGIGNYIGSRIFEETGYETRVTVLGHVQRGCPPIAGDRIIAAAFGVRAVELIAEGKFNRMVAWSERQVIDVEIEKAIAGYQDVDLEGTLVHTARQLGICLGD